MVEMISRMIETGYAYVHNGSVYFSIRRFPSYGELAQLDVSGLQTGASGVDTDKYDKEDARDFVLWKAWKPEDGEVFWNTDLGKGRPGWHMECSCMSIRYLGENHRHPCRGRGSDFPAPSERDRAERGGHGENASSITGCTARISNVDDEKMSKSLSNFLTVRDIVNTPDDARAFRYLVVSNHYRTAFNFSAEVLDAARNTMRRLDNFRRRLNEVTRTDRGEDVTSQVGRGSRGVRRLSGRRSQRRRAR